MMFALIDCNNFFASCEQVFNPKLKGKPLVVLSNNDGCVVARSQEARALDIPMGAPAFQCRDTFLQHNVITLSSNFDLYRDMSQRVIATLKTFECPLEVYSVDEAFMILPSADPELGLAICKRVMQWTGLPVSVGIAPTKTLAKVANKMAKKGARVYSIKNEEEAKATLQKFPVEDVWGIGRRLTNKLHAHAIRTAGALTQKPDIWIKRHLSVVGLRTVWELRAIPCSGLTETRDPRKTILSSRSFGKKVTDIDSLKEAISTFLSYATRKLRSDNLQARFLTVFIRGETFASASTTLPLPTAYTPDLVAAAHILLNTLFEEGQSYKKGGIVLADLVDENATQYDLFSKDPKEDQKRHLMQTFDHINEKYEKHTLFFGSDGVKKEWKGKRSNSTPRYTTCWDELPIVKN